VAFDSTPNAKFTSLLSFVLKQKKTTKKAPSSMENSNVGDQKQIWISLWAKFYTKLHT